MNKKSLLVSKSLNNTQSDLLLNQLIDLFRILLFSLLLALNPVLEDSGHNSRSGYPTFGHPPPTHHFLNFLGDDALGSVDHVNYLVLVGLADQKGDSKLLATFPTPSTLLSGADRRFPGVFGSSANVM